MYQFNINPNKIACREFIVNNHYLKSCPQASYYFTLEEDGKIIGVCLFGKPSRQNVGVDDCTDVLELSRLCVLDEAPKNTESYFISACIRHLKQQTDHEAVFTYADTTEGHQGTVYKAANFIFSGFTRRNYHYLTKEGKRLHKRQVWDRAKKNKVSELQQAETEQLLQVEELKKVKFVYYLIPEKDKRFIIYTLHDPRNDEVRYVGKSTRGRSRIRSHVRPSDLKAEIHKNHWIKQLKSLGMHPVLEILEVYKTPEELNEPEQFYISYLRAMGCRLTNITEGGEGTLGYKQKESTRELIRKLALERGATKAIPHNKKVHIFENGIEKRHCAKCESYKALDEFYRNKKTGKFLGSCGPCDVKRKKQEKLLHPERNYYTKLSPEEYEKSRSNAGKNGSAALFSKPGAREHISTKRSKPVIAIHESTGQKLEFPSALKAKEHGFHNKLIGDAIKNKRPYKGYYWTLKPKDNP